MYSRWKRLTASVATVIVAAVISTLALTAPATAVTPDDTENALEAFNSSYWDQANNVFLYSGAPTTGDAGWIVAEDLQNILDAYQRTNKAVYLSQLQKLHTGVMNYFGQHWPTTWAPGISQRPYDDLTWMANAFLRTADVTGDSTWRTPAEETWNYVYTDGYTSDLGGGLRWQHGTTIKSANTNFGSVIGGYRLCDQTGDQGYCTKAQGVADWAISPCASCTSPAYPLFDPTTGKVYNDVNLDGTHKSTDSADWTYNYGVFIGAMDAAYAHTGNSTYYNYAIAALNYVKTNLTQPSGILIDENTNSDSAEFKSDFIRYASEFIEHHDLTSYIPWLQTNANSVWSQRTSNSVMSDRWDDPAASTTTTWCDAAGTGCNGGAVSGVKAMQSVPSDGTNVAPQATVTASSSYSAAYAPSKAVDGSLGRHGTGEWASAGETHPWITLSWGSTVHSIDKVVLYDRMNGLDNANSGTLTFSDGTSVPVTGIATAGLGRTVTFLPKNVTWVKFVADGGTGANVGLSEIQTYEENDLAAGKTASSSSVYGANYSPANGVDNDQTTYWSSAGSSGAEWYQVDLGSAQTLNTVEVDWEAAFAKAYSVAVSVDGTNFTTVADRSGVLQPGVTQDRFATTSARYVRVTMTKGYLSGFTNYALWALKVFNQADDLAAGKTATASSIYSSAYVAANGTDADGTTRWSSAGTTGPEWYQVDLGSAQTIARVNIKWEAAFAKAYSISVSADGTNYTTVANITGIPGRTITSDTFSPTSARYVKITMTEGYQSAAHNFSFWGLNVYSN